jgi:GTPase SAR1 family protein
MMQRHDFESELTEEYARIVGRRAELERLSLQARLRKTLLVFGPEGAGKTRLLQEFVQKQPHALYVSHGRSPRDLLLSLANSLRNIPGVRSIPSHTSGIANAVPFPSGNGVEERPRRKLTVPATPMTHTATKASTSPRDFLAHTP